MARSPVSSISLQVNKIVIFQCFSRSEKVWVTPGNRQSLQSHCRGQGFESPQLHQPVAPDWHDDPGFEKARKFHRLAGRGRVSHGDWAVFRPNEPPISSEVSGRTIPFPGMQFARVGPRQEFQRKEARVGLTTSAAFGTRPAHINE